MVQRWKTPGFPIFSAIRAACEAGMTMRDGMPLHAALVEKDGYGVVFLGPSGMGKSTQAKLWVEHQGADIQAHKSCINDLRLSPPLREGRLL